MPATSKSLPESLDVHRRTRTVPMEIERVEVSVVAPKVQRFTLSHDLQEQYMTNTIVRVTTEDGSQGVGGVSNYTLLRLRSVHLRNAGLSTEAKLRGLAYARAGAIRGSRCSAADETHLRVWSQQRQQKDEAIVVRRRELPFEAEVLGAARADRHSVLTAKHAFV